MSKSKNLFVLFLFLLCFSTGGIKSGLAKKTPCPSVKKLESAFKRLHSRNVKIEKIDRSPVPGLCEVIISLSPSRKTIAYTDSQGRYLIVGRIIDLKTGERLTIKRLRELYAKSLTHSKLNKSQLAKLEKLVDMVYGDSPRVLYFITDPECPFCGKAEELVYELAKEKKVKLKVILFPIESIHPHAKAISEYLICNKKGYPEVVKIAELIEKYKKERRYKELQEELKKYEGNCKEAKAKIDKNIDFVLKKLHIRAVPTFIFPDGEVMIGLRDKNAILTKFKEIERKNAK